MRRVKLPLLALCLLLVWGVLVVPARASSEDGGITISEKGAVTIPATVTAIDSNMFQGNEEITSVTFATAKVTETDAAGNQVTRTIGVTSIGANAFAGCTNLTKVTLPSTLETMGSSAFEDCTSLTSVTIQTASSTTTDTDGVKTTKTVGLTEIGDRAFAGCGKLSITIPCTVTSIGYQAFYDSNLTSVTMQTGTVSVTEDVVTTTKTVGVTSIGASAFEGCENLTSATLPSTLETMGTCAFYGCVKLSRVSNLGKLKTIPVSAFEECTNLSSVSIPATVETIETRAFYNCGLTSVTIPENLFTIGESAFEGCTKLTTVNMPTTMGTDTIINGEGITTEIKPTIEVRAFYGCEKLTSIVIPEGIETIVTETFKDCKALAAVTFPTTLTTIENYAFENCKKLATLTVPADTITEINANAFLNCNAISTINYGGTWEEWTKDPSVTRLEDAISTFDTLQVNYRGYSITFNPNGGTLPTGSSPQFTGDDGILNSLPTPSKTGYSFLGWYTADDERVNTTDTVFKSSCSVYARWSEKITVTFDAKNGLDNDTNNAKNLVASLVTGVNGKLTKMPATPVRENYVFLGWYHLSRDVYVDENNVKHLIEEEVTTSTVFSGDTADVSGATPDTYVYARWTTACVVSFDANGGTLTGESKLTAKTDGTLEKFPSDPVRTGYTFLGWYDQESGGTKATTATVFETAATTLYAHWTGAYVISFNVNGGTLLGDTSQTTGPNGKLTDLPIPTRDNYAFDGWYTEINGGTRITVNTVFEDNTTVYAHWATPGSDPVKDTSIKTYSVSVSAGSGGTVTAQPTTDIEEGNRVIVTVTTGASYSVERVAVKGAGGTWVDVTQTGENRYTFLMPAENVTVVAEFAEIDVNGTHHTASFEDISPQDYYYSAVIWAAQKGITNGYNTTNLYAPNAVVDRGQMAVYLYRCIDSGASVNQTSSNFLDIKPTDYYYTEVLWLAQQGVTNGYGNSSRYAPEVTVDRKQMAMYLWRLAGCPEPVSTADDNPFIDVSEHSDYYKAILWVYETGISKGYGVSNVYAPDMPVDRGQMAVYLYRYTLVA